MGYKVLIADDELLTRKGIISKVRWSKFDISSVEEASDGEEALDKIRGGKPDIVITDIRMPELDGLSLIEKTLKEGHNLKFVIISAYSEFDYAKTAMAFGIKNYILKPIDSYKLEKVLKDVLEEIKNEGEKNAQLMLYQQQMEISRHMKRELLLSGLFLNNSSESLLNTLLKENHIEFLYPYFFTAVVALNMDELLEANEDQVLLEARKVIQKVIEPYKNVIFFRNVSFVNEFILIFNVSKKEDAAYLEEAVIKKILKEMPEQLKIQAAAGISMTVSLASEIAKAYNQAKTAVCESMQRGYDRIFRFSDFISEGLVVKEIEGSKHILFAYILNGRKGAAAEYINSVFSGNNPKLLNHIHLKIYCTEVLIELEKLMRKNNMEMEQIVAEKYNFVSDIVATGNTRQMMLSLQKIVAQVIDNLPKDKKNVSQNLVVEVVDFINDNYKEEISLKRISNMYYINPNYFCKIFKEFTGENFNMYVTKVRLEKARHFLETTSLTINEVAGMVGFNPKYFCKVFKNELKMTPKEYILRHSRCGLPQ
jgi:two-component system response regulator YesN